uniref:DNA polymerase epsilon catalytic subunit n=1 Tax=Heterorhabditis bacteriophora TaxID=37862 RepID=A0A1I7WRW8_HETBA
MAEDAEELVAKATENDSNYEERVEKIKLNDSIDSKFGFERYVGTTEKNAWLVNIQPSELVIAYPFRPYFYIATTASTGHQVASYLAKKYGNFLVIEHLDKEDLDLKNHLSGLKRPYFKLSFPSLNELARVKRDLIPIIKKTRIVSKKNLSIVRI